MSGPDRLDTCVIPGTSITAQLLVRLPGHALVKRSDTGKAEWFRSAEIPMTAAEWRARVVPQQSSN